MLEKTNRFNLLYDFYEPLLTDKQKRYLEDYYVHDCSLGEIAEAHNVSRQAVYEQLKRAEALLEAYEEKLGLLRKHQERLGLIARLRALLEAQGCLGAEAERLLAQLAEAD
ncbi:MAG: putative DNA-binding protein [Calditerricola sp.]|nr:putative DNA-binding protein [Bacillota bacterium]MCG0313268.1 putative DNA-binding protein [Calditerricola sp.]